MNGACNPDGNLYMLTISSNAVSVIPPTSTRTGTMRSLCKVGIHHTHTSSSQELINTHELELGEI